MTTSSAFSYASPGFLLWRVTLSWQRQMRAALAPHDLTHVQFVLLASLWWLADHGAGPPTQAQLAEQAGTDLMMTSQVVRRLAGRGLVTRARDRVDNRAWRLALTPPGHQVLAGALADVEAADQAYFAVLGPGGGAFRQGLAALVAARAERSSDRRALTAARPGAGRGAGRRRPSVSGASSGRRRR
jgi:DNA-binding MarR family transcriptional regulator